MRTFLLSIVLLSASIGDVCAQSSVPADSQSGNRFQMVVVPKGPNSFIDTVVFLDTQAGDVWKWTEAPAMANNNGANFIMYLGKLLPGSKPGEIVGRVTYGQPKNR